MVAKTQRLHCLVISNSQSPTLMRFQVSSAADLTPVTTRLGRNWAIGTGENAELNYIEEIHTFIKKELKNKRKSKNFVSVVYGGSVNLDNCKEIYSSDNVDGLLIGGASLDPNTFTEIYNMS
mgnify:CR=1 FL=1